MLSSNIPWLNKNKGAPSQLFLHNIVRARTEAANAELDSHGTANAVRVTEPLVADDFRDGSHASIPDGNANEPTRRNPAVLSSSTSPTTIGEQGQQRHRARNHQSPPRPRTTWSADSAPSSQGTAGRRKKQPNLLLSGLNASRSSQNPTAATKPQSLSPVRRTVTADSAGTRSPMPYSPNSPYQVRRTVTADATVNTGRRRNPIPDSPNSPHQTTSSIPSSAQHPQSWPQGVSPRRKDSNESNGNSITSGRRKGQANLLLSGRNASGNSNAGASNPEDKKRSPVRRTVTADAAGSPVGRSQQNPYALFSDNRQSNRSPVRRTVTADSAGSYNSTGGRSQQIPYAPFSANRNSNISASPRGLSPIRHQSNESADSSTASGRRKKQPNLLLSGRNASHHSNTRSSTRQPKNSFSVRRTVTADSAASHTSAGSARSGQQHLPPSFTRSRTGGPIPGVSMHSHSSNTTTPSTRPSNASMFDRPSQPFSSDGESSEFFADMLIQQRVAEEEGAAGMDHDQLMNEIKREEKRRREEAANHPTVSLHHSRSSISNNSDAIERNIVQMRESIKSEVRDTLLDTDESLAANLVLEDYDMSEKGQDSLNLLNIAAHRSHTSTDQLQLSSQSNINSKGKNSSLTASVTNSSFSTVEYSDSGQPDVKHNLPAGTERPGAYRGAARARYDRVRSLHLTGDMLRDGQTDASEHTDRSESASGNNNDDFPTMVSRSLDIEQQTEHTSNCISPRARLSEIPDEEQPTEHTSSEGVALQQITPAEVPKTENSKIRKKFLIMGTIVIAVVVLLAIIIPIAVVIGGESGEDDGPNEEVESLQDSSEISESTHSGEVINKALLPLLDESTWDIIERSPDSVQHKAYDWLINDPSLESYVHWRTNQRFALATFYYAMGGPKWDKTRTMNWLSYNASIHECDWMSYESNACEDGHVVLLNVSRLRGFDGILPAELALLTRLQTLELSGNKLYGSLDELMRGPLNSTSYNNPLPSLQSFKCSRCGISGSLPTSLSQMTNLKVLTLNDNEIDGLLPTEIGELQGLSHLMLKDNMFSEEVPTELGLMTSLEYLSVATNRLTKLPTEVGQLTKLIHLDVEGNAFDQALPTEVGLLTELSFLNFRAASLTGILPYELSNLSKLTHLNLEGNSLSGSISKQLFQSFSSLKKLHLTFNNIEGHIPTEVGLMPKLSEIKLGANELTSTIPSEFGLLMELKLVELADNQLTGSIPDELLVLPKLKRLIVTGNPNLEGVVPTVLCTPECD